VTTPHKRANVNNLVVGGTRAESGWGDTCREWLGETSGGWVRVQSDKSVYACIHMYGSGSESVNSITALGAVNAIAALRAMPN
jgi:hypothetical protein